MGDVRVRNLDDGVVALWKERARRHGQSLEAELRSFLSEEAHRSLRDLGERMQQGRDRLRQEFGPMPDSADGIRAERDQRG